MQQDNTKVKRITPQSKASSQNRLMRYYTKHSRVKLGLSKTRLARFINLNSHIICKRDLFLVLRKIKFNEPFEKIGPEFSMRASTAFYIFKHRVPQIAKHLSNYIDWFGNDLYKKYNPLDVSVNLLSMVDHFVIDRKVKYFISCSLFGFINFLSCGYPMKMANKKMVEQSKFVSKLPEHADVMGPKKYKFLSNLIQDNDSTFSLWQTFEQALVVNGLEITHIDKSSRTPMIGQVKHHLRRFKILSDSKLDSKLLPIMDDIMMVCAILCNLRKNWIQFVNSQSDVDQEYYEDQEEEGEEVEEEEDSNQEEAEDDDGLDINNFQETEDIFDRRSRAFFIAI